MKTEDLFVNRRFIHGNDNNELIALTMIRAPRRKHDLRILIIDLLTLSLSTTVNMYLYWYTQIETHYIHR